MAEGKLVSDEIIFDLFAQEMTKPGCENGWVFDGFPRTGNQAHHLNEFMADQGQTIDLVLEFLVPEWIAGKQAGLRWVHPASGR